MFLWRVLASQGVDVGMSLSQLLILMNALFAEMLVVRTLASAWNYEGIIINLYTRPYPIFGQIISQTIGG